jgi:hypothetical protein
MKQSVRILVAAAVGVMVSAAAAQTRSANDPFADGNGVRPPGPQVIDYSFEYVRDYPATEVRAVPPARARAVQSRLEFERARRALHTTLNWLREDFEFSDEYVQARNEEQAAHEAYKSARHRVLRDLYERDSDYRALVQLQNDLTRRLEDLKHRRPPDNEQILAAAQLKMRYAQQARQIESDALAADDQLQEASRQLREAGATAMAMRQRFQRETRRDEDVLAAKRTMDDSRITYLTANAYLESVLIARRIAVNYAYDLHYFDRLRNRHATFPVTYGVPHRYTYGDYSYVYRY